MEVSRESMLEYFTVETSQLIENLEKIMIVCEKSKSMDSSAINEIFRVMHTIKGSASMMVFNNIATLAHALEDLFYYLREEKPQEIDYPKLTDLVLEGLDFIRNEMQKIENKMEVDGNPGELVGRIKGFLAFIKQPNASSKEEKAGKQQSTDVKETANSQSISNIGTVELKEGEYRYKAVVFFEEGCEMENVRAYTVMHNLKQVAEIIAYTPSDIAENPDSAKVIVEKGFYIKFKSDKSFEEIEKVLSDTVYLEKLEIFFDSEEAEVSANPENQANNSEVLQQENIQKDESVQNKENTQSPPAIQTEAKTPSGMGNATSVTQKYISVSVEKLDKLMDLMGELVISEAMVTQHPEIAGLKLKNYYKATRQLRKITGELQDTVMAIRMVPLSSTFQKISRLTRDMGRKLQKEIELVVIGEETEVDKNIIENISDPLMHIIRNSIDHGIEQSEERKSKGKPENGTITLEAKNSGGEVWIIVRDDGKGLDKHKILEKAKKNNLLVRPESEMTDREIYSMIFLPGFSTKENITEFSGRGVGMDVVRKNIEKLGGLVLIDSKPGEGTVISMKIPLTLAIIDGMLIKVGKERYTIPTVSIKESFKLRGKEPFFDPEGNEMLMLRGDCYPITRLSKIFNVKSGETQIDKGIFIIVEEGEKMVCLFADALLGKQQVVVKALPKYLKKMNGIAGCTLLGDGDVSLILDVAGLISY